MFYRLLLSSISIASCLKNELRGGVFCLAFFCHRVTQHCDIVSPMTEQIRLQTVSEDLRKQHSYIKLPFGGGSNHFVMEKKAVCLHCPAHPPPHWSNCDLMNGATFTSVAVLGEMNTHLSTMAKPHQIHRKPLCLRWMPQLVLLYAVSTSLTLCSGLMNVKTVQTSTIYRVVRRAFSLAYCLFGCKSGLCAIQNWKCLLKFSSVS